jgi:hypothetical protein
MAPRNKSAEAEPPPTGPGPGKQCTATRPAFAMRMARGGRAVIAAARSPLRTPWRTLYTSPIRGGFARGSGHRSCVRIADRARRSARAGVVHTLRATHLPSVADHVCAFRPTTRPGRQTVLDALGAQFTRAGCFRRVRARPSVLRAGPCDRRRRSDDQVRKSTSVPSGDCPLTRV